MIDLFCVKRAKILEGIDEAGQLVALKMDKLKDSEESRDVCDSVILTIVISC
jgi:hypothetical protein